MDIKLHQIDTQDERDLKKQLLPFLYRKVFHATDQHGFDGIIQSKNLVSGDNINPSRQKWPKAKSYFRNRKYVSFCDFYHPTRCSTIRDGYRKYTFWDQRGDVTYLFILKYCFYSKLLTWTDLDSPAKYNEMVVPYIESGLISPVPLSYFDTVIRVNLWEKKPWWKSISDEDADSLLRTIEACKTIKK